MGCPYTLWHPCRSFLNHRNDTEVELKCKYVPNFPFIVSLIIFKNNNKTQPKSINPRQKKLKTLFTKVLLSTSKSFSLKTLQTCMTTKMFVKHFVLVVHLCYVMYEMYLSLFAGIIWDICLQKLSISKFIVFVYRE